MRRAKNFRRKLFSGRGGWRGCGLRIVSLRISLNVASTCPRRHFIHSRTVFIVHDGIQRVDRLHALLDERTDDGGVANAVFADAFHVRLGIRDGLTVGLQISHETGGHFMRPKLGHQRGLDGLDSGADQLDSDRGNELGLRRDSTLSGQLKC